MMRRYLSLLLMLPLLGSPAWGEDKPADAPTTRNADEKPKKADIPARQLPSAVKRAFKRDYPRYKIVAVVRMTYKDETVHYKVAYTDKNRQEQDVMYDDEGNELEMKE